jgi:hypothetical protein
VLQELNRRHVYLACFAVHFSIIFAVCCRDTLSVLAKGYTFCPPSLDIYWQKAEGAVSAALGEHLALSNPVRQSGSTYIQLAGIGFGYGFFAPNVPDSYKLVFELHYPDGRVEYELPRVATPGSGLRVATLIDNVAQTHYDPLRELMVKMVAYSVWQEHPDATMIRAVLGFVSLPNAAQFEQGISESYEFLYAYDFRFSSQSPESGIR